MGRDNGGYPKEPLIVNELENYFDPDIFVTQRVRQDSRITENKWRGTITAKMKIMIDEYKVRRQGLELFVTQMDESYACWYTKKGKNSSYSQATGDAWGSGSENDNIAAGVGQSLLGYRQMNQHPQPSSSASQTETKHGNHSLTCGGTTHATETSSKNTITKKRKRSTSISETSDASTKPKSKRHSENNVSASTIDNPMTSLNAGRVSIDKPQKKKAFG
ncbi:hypothetical protein BPOR_0675g00050 [Botrytis porri]|uniref:Uncharacterized protein n=1 Tax=Botrytis porri TaxID=87229 RepID=A0A4Z1KCX2_9HELO|nr:hypothetical protein BPOR_0675g00050 [Botrytis porri]